MTARDDTLATLGARLNAIDERLHAIGLGAGDVAIAHVPLRAAAVDALILEWDALVTERDAIRHRLEVVARGWTRCRDWACDVCRRGDEPWAV